MGWHKKEIIRNVFGILIGIILTLLALALVYCSVIYDMTEGIFAFGLMTLFGGLVIFSNCKSLSEHTKNNKEVKENNVLTELNYVNKYKSDDDMRAAFDAQRKNKIYQDNEFIITEEFLGNFTENVLLLLDGILDAKLVVQKVNTIIDSVTLGILYYDGEEYVFKFTRPGGISFDMKERVNAYEYVLNVIAQKGANFRKHPNFKF